MACSKILVLIGLALNTIGAVVVISRSAFRFIGSWFFKEVKSKITEEAISAYYGRMGGPDMVYDPFVKGYVASFRSSFWGFVMIVFGFILQFAGNL